ncbi:MAG: hypothetical protein ACI8RD_009666 [Bacillariaceae sp.]|jgi:hypothetical protein
MHAPSIISISILLMLVFFLIVIVIGHLNFSYCIMGSDTDSLDEHIYQMRAPNPRIVCTLLSPYEP